MQQVLPWRRVDALLSPAALREGAAWWALLAMGAALSWLATGFVFGISNNVFHLPIVAGLHALPQFADDAFVQSLRGFSSGLWMLLEGSDRVVATPVLFTALLAASKMLSLLGMCLIAQELGLAGWPQRCAFVALVAMAPLLVGTAYAGHGGLFIGYFSHSELANGFSLLMLWACMRRRFDQALAFLGLVFFLNAFMAVWHLLPLLWLAWRAWRADPALPRRQAKGLALAALFAAALAAPVLARAVGAGLLGGGAAAMPAFDHRAFLREIYPYHFLAQTFPPAQWLGLLTVAATALLALRAIGPRADPLRVALAAFGVVYGIGVVLPWFTASSTLLNLHLLRVSVELHFIAAIALACLVVQWASGGDAQRRWLWSPSLALCLLAARPMLVGALLLLPLAGRRAAGAGAPAPGWMKALGIALVVATAGLQWRAVSQTQQSSAALRASVADWCAIAAQVERSTPARALVMLPLDTESWSPADAGSAVFESRSRRQVWVDHKRGAAVLWQPAYHARWKQRVDELAALHDWPQRLAYAAAHRIAVVVDRCDGLPTLPAGQLLARAGRLCAVAVKGGAT